MHEIQSMTQQAVDYLSGKIEDLVDQDTEGTCGAVDINHIEYGLNEYYVHFTIENFKTGREIVGTWIGIFRAHPHGVEDVEGKWHQTYTFPGSGETVYEKEEEE